MEEFCRRVRHGVLFAFGGAGKETVLDTVPCLRLLETRTLSPCCWRNVADVWCLCFPIEMMRIKGRREYG